MTDIIDFKEAKIIKETDDDQMFIAPDGSKWFKFFVDYEFDCEAGGFGVPEHILNDPNAIFPKTKIYSFDIWAQNEEEAKARLAAIKEKAILGGRICTEILA